MAAMDCAMRDLPPMVAMAFPNRAHMHISESVQSFEERYPGVWIRKKKKRDLPRSSSTNSMDSWCSDLDNLPQTSSLQSTVYEPNEPASESLQSTLYEPHLDSLQSTLYEPNQESLQGTIYEPTDPCTVHHGGGYHMGHHDPRRLGEQLMARLEHGSLGRRGTSPPRSSYLMQGKAGGGEELHIDSYKLKAHGMQAVQGLYEGHPAVLQASTMGTARRHRLAAQAAHGARVSDQPTSPSFTGHEGHFSDSSSSPQRFDPSTPTQPHFEDNVRPTPHPQRSSSLPSVTYPSPTQPQPMPQAHQPYAQPQRPHQRPPAPRPIPLTHVQPPQQSHRMDPYDAHPHQQFQRSPTSPSPYGHPPAHGPQMPSPHPMVAAPVEHYSYTPTAKPPTPTSCPTASYPTFTGPHPPPPGQPIPGTVSPQVPLMPAPRPHPIVGAPGLPPPHLVPGPVPTVLPPPHLPTPPPLPPAVTSVPTVDLATATIQSSALLGCMPAGNPGNPGHAGSEMDAMAMMQQALSSLPGAAVQHAAAAAAAGLSAALPHMDVTAFTEQQRAALGLLSVIGEKKGAEDKAAVDPRKYKTRMCRNWEETGGCPYEHTCCFAHGPAELRNVADNHKLLASIGYFSNVILLAMTNGQKPALPPHCLYQQPSMFKPPETAEELKQCTTSLPPGVSFPFQEPLPSALRALKGEGITSPTEAPAGKRRRRRRGRRHRKRATAATGDADAPKGEEEEGEDDDGDDEPEEEVNA